MKLLTNEEYDVLLDVFSSNSIHARVLYNDLVNRGVSSPLYIKLWAGHPSKLLQNDHISIFDKSSYSNMTVKSFPSIHNFGLYMEAEDGRRHFEFGQILELTNTQTEHFIETVERTYFIHYKL